MKKWFERRIWLLVWPLFMSFIPIGMAFGILAEKLGFTLWQILGFSVVVFAGSAQFIAISMLAGGSSPMTVMLTTFVINLRHFLFSSTLAPYFKKVPKSFLFGFAYGITDESFAVNIREFDQGNWTPEEAFRVNMITWFFWVLSTVSGAVVGEWMNADFSVIVYALTAMFIGLWSFYVHQRPFLIIGILGGVLAVCFFPYLSYKLHIILAAVIAATAGCFLEYRILRKKEAEDR